MINPSAICKWNIWATTIFLVWIAVFPATGAERLDSQINLTQEEEIYIRDHPVIRVHNETDWPPFNFAVNGKPQGFSIDYMNLLASMTGFKVEYVTGPTWNGFMEMMKSGDLDVMLNIVKTPERQKYLLYTSSYAINPNAILSRRDTPYDNLEQLFGKTVSLPKGFFYEEILKRDFPRIKLHLVKNVQESMRAVIFGKADAAFGELAVFNYLKEREMMTGLVLSGEVKMGSPEYAILNIATRKDDPLLISILRKAVKAVDPKVVKALRQSWIGNVKTSLSAPTLRLTDKEQNWLSEHKQIRIGVDPSYPPFEFIDEKGVFSGMSSDYIRLVSERLGISMEVVPGLSWEEAIEGIRERSLDVLPAAVMSPERELFVKFSNPHMAFPIVIVTRDDYSLIAGLSDLNGKTTAQMKGYAVMSHIEENYPEINPVLFKNPLQALQSVALGKTDATVLNLAVATYLIKKHNLANLKVAAPADIVLPGLSFAVRKDWPELTGILNKALASITPEEESAIRSKWASVSYNTGIDIKQVFQASGVAIVILIVIVVWNRRLQIEVKQRKQAEEHMEAAKNEAERLTQAKSDFIAVISHEIRTPMNGVLGMARLLTETKLDAEQQECVDTVMASGEALLTIIDDLLDISKFDAGKLHLESIPFIIDVMVEQSITQMKLRADEKGLALSSVVDGEIPGVIIGDPLRLRQIILNLISNAIKFTNKGSIEFAVRMVERTQESALLSFTVTDTGKGMSPDVLDKLFSAYDQGSAEVARKYGGTGLGLAICRRLASRMDGKITVESAVGKGSIFQFNARFKIDTTADAAQLRKQLTADHTPHSNTQSAHPLRVLQVEDNETNRTVIERVLSKVGHTIISVENGAEALTAIETDDFDVILMDRHMPIMDGIEATQRIREMAEPIASIPIIGITASASQDEIHACIEAGMDTCLTKPVEAVKLRALLENLSGENTAPSPMPEMDAKIESATSLGQQPIDLGGLSRILGEDDEDELFSMLKIFNNEFPKLLVGLETAIKERDVRSVHDCAHTAKGAARNAAALALAAMLMEIEVDAHLENWEETERRTDAVKSEYGRVVRFCDAHEQKADKT